MKIINLFNKGKKSITIKNTSWALISNIDAMEFQVDLYKQDFKEIMENMFPQYNIELDIVDDVDCFFYPKIKGNITETEKSELIEAVYSDALITLHANEKYYISNTKDTESNDIKDNNLKRHYHKDDSQCIIDGRYDLSNFKERELTSVELYFLKYIATIKSNPLNSISGDWTHDYHLKYQDVLNQFVGQKLVEVEELSLSEKINLIHTVDDLKGILKFKELPVKGTKPTLIERMIENSDENELKDYRNQRYIRYKLTEKGMELTTPLNPSITRDMELEDKSYHLVLNNEIDKAYKIISSFKAQKDFPGLGIQINISGNEKAIIELDDVKLFKYNKLININLNLPENIRDKQKNINSCIIVGDMFGCKSFEITKLIERLINTGLDDEQINKYVDYGLSFIR